MISPMQDEMAAQIASDLGVSELPVEEQQKLISQFGEVALKAATLAVLQKLGEDKRIEFAKLAEAGDAAALQAFLDREVPGHEEIVKAAIAEEVTKFKSFKAD
jgi:hypothetical protein